MKKLFAFLLVAGIMVSCDNSGSGTDAKVDSIEARKDSLLQNVDSAFGEKIDSLEQRKERLKEKFDSTADRKIDSIKQKS